MIEALVIAAIVGVLIALALPSGDWDFSHRFPPPSPKLEDDFTDVAGEYRQGATRGRTWRLKILPDGRYSFLWSGCCGVYHRESGATTRVGEDVVLTPAKPIEPRIDRTFRPLRWGPRIYLVPPVEIRDFCDAIISDNEPRNEVAGRFYLLGDEEAVAGVPELPGEWAAYLRENLVIGTIIGVTSQGRARIDVGSSAGIRVGSPLTIQGRGRFGPRYLKVVAVDVASCEAEDSWPGEADESIKAGWKVVATRELEATSTP